MWTGIILLAVLRFEKYIISLVFLAREASSKASKRLCLQYEIKFLSILATPALMILDTKVWASLTPERSIEESLILLCLCHSWNVHHDSVELTCVLLYRIQSLFELANLSQAVYEAYRSHDRDTPWSPVNFQETVSNEPYRDGRIQTTGRLSQGRRMSQGLLFRTQ
jgi:hypothetical protein